MMGLLIPEAFPPPFLFCNYIYTHAVLQYITTLTRFEVTMMMTVSY